MAHFVRRFFLSILFLLAPSLLLASGISYKVDFQGLSDQNALKTIKSVSQLTTLKKRPPASINALRYRAESDIPEMLKVLHAYGYYEATIHIRVDENGGEVRAVVIIRPGPIYKIDDFVIHLYENNPAYPVFCEAVNLEALEITLGKPAIAQKIISSELKLMELLAECGYPLAQSEERQIIVDGDTKGMRIALEINTGPLSRFGPVNFKGLKEVKPRYIDQKTVWKEGEFYDSRLVEKTQKKLMDSGLFSSALITHREKLNEEGLVPMEIEVTESKHRSINAGLSYQTVFGPGLTFGWENRNIGGMGRKLSLQGDVTRISHAGTATLLVPDLRRVGQDFVAQAIAMRESIRAYVERSYSFSSRLERKFGTRTRIAIGAKVERLFVTDSVQNGVFTLLEVPLYFRWSTANDLLNPTEGSTLQYRTVPSLNSGEASQFYLYQELYYSTYYALTKNASFVLAQQITIGSIASHHLSDVPVPKRFLAGTEQELRGYRYKTVSPLIGDKPEGGRSAIYYTVETRFRISPKLGLVPFFDIGNVHTSQIPKVTGKWFKSVGIGFRYFSFLGPLRIDVAFPLDRRSVIEDPFYRVLVSIGQTF